MGGAWSASRRISNARKLHHKFSAGTVPKSVYTSKPSPAACVIACFHRCQSLGYLGQGDVGAIGRRAVLLPPRVSYRSGVKTVKASLLDKGHRDVALAICRNGCRITFRVTNRRAHVPVQRFIAASHTSCTLPTHGTPQTGGVVRYAEFQ